MSDCAILLYIFIGTFVLSIGIWLAFITLSVPVVAVPAGGLAGIGLCVLIRGAEAALKSKPDN